MLSRSALALGLALLISPALADQPTDIMSIFQTAQEAATAAASDQARLARTPVVRAGPPAGVDERLVPALAAEGVSLEQVIAHQLGGSDRWQDCVGNCGTIWFSKYGPNPERAYQERSRAVYYLLTAEKTCEAVLETFGDATKDAARCYPRPG